MFAVPLTAVLVGGGPWLFSAVLGPGWGEAGRYAAVLAPAIGLGMLSGAVSSLPMAVGRQRTFTVASVGGSGLALAGLAVAGAAGLRAEAALGVYSGLLCVQYVALLVWFRKLAFTASASR